MSRLDDKSITTVSAGNPVEKGNEMTTDKEHYAIEVLREGTLHDDELRVADDGYRFNGKYAAVVIWWTFQTTWTDEPHVKRFRLRESADKFIAKMGLDVTAA